jgi:hypothetical protein
VVVPEVAPGLKTIPVPAVEATKLPFVAVIFPRVAVIVVPAVTLVVAAREVVAVNEPGAVIAAGSVRVTVAPEAAVVI